MNRSNKKRKVLEVFRDTSDEEDITVTYSRMLMVSKDGRRCFSRLVSSLKPECTALNKYTEDEEQTYLDTEFDVDQFIDEDHGLAMDATKNTAKKRYQASDAPLLEWLGVEGKKGYRDEYLLEDLRLEARASWDNSPCACSPAGRNERLFRCDDCLGMEVLCHTCCVAAHKHLPLHNIKMWNGSYFERMYLKDLGLRVQLGHGDCCSPQRGNVNFLVIDINGIHPVDVYFCGCDKRVSHRQQLLRTGWYPATVHNPRTACTKQALHQFLRLTWSSKVSAFEYYRTLELLTDSTRINLPATRYSAFLRMIRQTRHLKLMKHGGRGNMEGGVSMTVPGELAIVCPACPHPEMNLPKDWKEADPSRKFLYFLFLALDANFRLKGRNRSSDAADPGLHTGLAYFVPQEAYNDHISLHAAQKDMSTCSGFNSMAHANSKFSTGLRATGVGLSVCARHEFVRPTGVGDLQKGERYCNMDYIFFSSLVPLLLISVVVSYDIACQWKVNLLKRMQDLPAELRLPLTLAMTCFLFGVPKFHAPAHAEVCATPHSFNLMPGVGRTDGEGVERTWADLNRVANSTKEMGPGARHDTIDCQIGHHNWGKLIGIGELLSKRLRSATSESHRHVGALEEFNNAVEANQRDGWSTMVIAWESDKSKPNPYISSKKYTSEADIRTELAREDEDAEGTGRPGRHEASPGSFVTLGLLLEDSQRRIKEFKKNSSDTATHILELKKRRATAHRQILRYQVIQAIYMVGVTALLSRLPDTATTEPEDVPLVLPSSLNANDRSNICTSGVDMIEERFRESQCRDALSKLRTYLHTKSHFTKYKNTNIRGQRACTRANGLIDRVSHKIKSVAEKYRLARVALLALRGHGAWEDELRVLHPQDIVSIDTRDEAQPNGQSRPTLGEGHRVTPWIWKTAGTLGEDEGLNEALRIEWLKSRARAARWSEEVLLLKEEMRRVLVSMEWKADWWHTRGAVHSDPEYRAGMRAYANRQAAMYRKLRARFLTLWKKQLKSDSDRADEQVSDTVGTRIVESEADDEYEDEEEDETDDD